MDTFNKTERSCLIIILLAIMLALCIVMGFISFLLYEEFFQPDRTPTPYITATNVIPSGDAVWDRIQAAGKIVVGTSADYRPFSYIEGNNAFQGYDIALIQEIGRRLNLNVEIKNMAFDGLGDALQLGQIDVAIGAISVTPDRDSLIDFSNAYYVSEDAIVADRDDNVIVTDVNSMASIRVGVQRGSTYETWLQQTLVQPGFMPPQYLITYESVDEALQALLAPNPKITLVIMDFLPAQAATQNMNVKIVQSGFNPQNYAIAIATGAYTLQGNLNRILTQLQNDGTLNLLAQYYLDISNPPTPAPPKPTQPPATPSACLDGMQFVADINYPDNNMTTLPVFSPGTVINKGWRIRNSGTCTWDNRYTLVYSGSNPPNSPVSGNPVPIQGNVAPGGIYDIYASITAPTQSGRYQSFWMLRNPNGKTFGERVWAGFQVINDATPTSAPQTPVINTFNASPNQILQGQCISLNWQYSGQDLSLTRLFRGDQVIQMDLPFTGSTVDCPPVTGPVSYQLVVDSEFGGSARASQQVWVTPSSQPTPTIVPTQEQPPVIYTFSIDTTEIQLGGCATLFWAYGGTSLVQSQLTRNGEVILLNLPFTGSKQDCPPTAGYIEYKLKVDTEFSGSADRSIFLNVLNPLR